MELSERARERQKRIQQVVALLKQQGSSILGSVPERVAEFRTDSTAMSLCQRLNEINRGLMYVLYLIVRSTRTDPDPAAWSTEVERFFDILEQLDAAIAGVRDSDMELFLHFSHDLCTYLGQAGMFLGHIQRIQAKAGSPPAEIEESDNV